MKLFISTLFTLFVLSNSNAQTQDSLVTIADNIVREATQLYKSEKASWYGWQQHFVMSEHFVSIWNGDTNKLLILTKEAWELMNKDGGKKRKKKEKN